PGAAPGRHNPESHRGLVLRPRRARGAGARARGQSPALARGTGVDGDPRPRRAAASVGIRVARYKLSAFVWSSVVTALAGALFAYHRGFVSVEAFGFFVAMEYIAMIIIGGLGSALGAVLGAAFATLLPYAIDPLVAGVSPDAAQYYVFPAKFGAFGLLMALFLLFEPLGLVG